MDPWTHWHGTSESRLRRSVVTALQSAAGGGEFKSPVSVTLEEQRAARVAFGYSPLFGCFLLTSPPVLLEKDPVAPSLRRVADLSLSRSLSFINGVLGPFCVVELP